MSTLASAIQRGTRGAQPAATAVSIGTLYCVTDESNLVERSTGAVWQSYSASGAGAGTVTNTGTLTANKAMIGNGSTDITASAATGVAHLSSGTLTGSNVDLASEVTGDLPFANLTQIAGLSVLGVTGSSTADVAALTAGANFGLLYRVSSSSLAFYLPKTVLAKNSGTQSINNNSTTTLAFDSEDWDNDTMHDTVTNNSRITFTTAGKYAVSSYVQFASNGAGERYTDIRLNGTTVIATDSRMAITGGDISGNTLSFDYAFSAADYVEVRVFQTSGGSLAVTARFSAKQILGV